MANWTVSSKLKSLSGRFFSFFFQERISFGGFGPNRTCLKGTVITSWIRFINNRFFQFLIVGNQSHTASQWSHFSILSVDLANVSNSSTQHVYSNVYTMFVFEIDSLRTSASNLRSRIWNKSGHNAANFVSNFV